MMPPEVERRRAWSRQMIGRAAGLEIPVYGSSEWFALPEGHQAKVAAVVRAAECWARSGDDLADDIARELEATRRIHKRLEDEEYQARAAEHRERWAHLTVVPDALDRLAGRAEPPADLYEIGRRHIAERRSSNGGDAG